MVNKKVHVDTNAVTRKGVEDDFESLLRFYYGMPESLTFGCSHTSTAPDCSFPCSKMLSIQQDVEMDELRQR